MAQVEPEPELQPAISCGCATQVLVRAGLRRMPPPTESRAEKGTRDANRVTTAASLSD